MTLGKYLLLPIQAIQLASGAKSFRDNPFIGSRRLNRRGLHLARVRIAAALCDWRRRRLARNVRPEWIEEFQRNGFVAIRDVVPQEQFDDLRAAILAYRGLAREMRQGDAITRRMAIDPDMLRAIPALRALLSRKDLQALFDYVASFRTTPLHYIQTIVSHTNAKGTDPQEALHADTFHSSLKSWLFLNPVAADEGPFSYVKGSHRFTPERLEWEYQRSLDNPHEIDKLSARGSPRATAQDLEAMKLPPAEGLAMPANTLVVADTVGFHARGNSVKPGQRVEIWSYARRNPFLPWVGLDLLSLPGIAERRVGWLWAFRDRFAKSLGQPWRPVGVRSALDEGASPSD
ncbi:phytanoyl-CoA dioxygenase family protein [Erythrobacteraceae bacterium E2-1 Yellow Sea]|nr:phytanoyl-CoA dioxygenase family protein [Erythrobacteraceae bacterium E2-1 Yellow Sea]